MFGWAQRARAPVWSAKLVVLRSSHCPHHLDEVISRNEELSRQIAPNTMEKPGERLPDPQLFRNANVTELGGGQLNGVGLDGEEEKAGTAKCFRPNICK